MISRFKIYVQKQWLNVNHVTLARETTHNVEMYVKTVNNQKNQFANVITNMHNTQQSN